MKEEFKGILENISQNNNELDKLLNIESVDEIYDYFLEKIPELSVEEFDNLMIEILETYTNEQKRIYKLDHKDLDNLAGGTNFGTKLSSGVLALLSIFQAPVFGNNNEAHVNAISSPNASISSKITKAYQYRKNVVSDKFQKTKEWIKKHPIKSTVGTIVVIVAFYFTTKYFKNKKPKLTIADR